MAGVLDRDVECTMVWWRCEVTRYIPKREKISRWLSTGCSGENEGGKGRVGVAEGDGVPGSTINSIDDRQSERTTD
jgi:hypothetical protein